MSSKPVKISSNFGESINTGNQLQGISTIAERGNDLNKIKVIKSEFEENKEVHEEKTYKLYQKFLAELFGTSMLLYHCCGAAVFNKELLYVGVLSSSLGVLFIVYCFVNISGAHFNPAVSLPLYVSFNFKRITSICSSTIIRCFYWLLFYCFKSQRKV